MESAKSQGEIPMYMPKAEGPQLTPHSLGQRFQKRGTQNNFVRNQDALFILIRKYLFFMSIKELAFH